MRNPYFFVFLTMLSGLFASFELNAQTTKLSPPPIIAGKPISLYELERPRLPGTEQNSRASQPQRKVNVDLSTVPDLGSAQTEAGLAAPGFAPQMPTYTPPSYTRAGEPAPAESPMNVGMTSAVGMMNLFQMAIQVGQRVNPRASGPLFVGECTDCATTTQAPENRSGSPLNRHNPELILSYIRNEDVLPYPELSSTLRDSYVNATIESLDQLGGFTSINEEEFTSLCPNYSYLNLNQRKALVVFAYSEVFRQTTNYNFNQIASAGEGSGQQRVGACRLQHSEVSSIYRTTFGLNLYPSESEFNATFARNPRNNIFMCTATLYHAAIHGTATPRGGLRSIFPDLNHDTIKENLSALKMCRPSLMSEGKQSIRKSNPLAKQPLYQHLRPS